MLYKKLDNYYKRDQFRKC